MAEQDQDRNEDATPFKLEEARKKGSVAKSADFLSLAAIAGAVGFLYWMGWSTFQKQLAFDQLILRRAGQLSFEPSTVLDWLRPLFVETLFLLVPFFAVIAIVAIVANMAQTGPVFSFKPVSPDFSRINPAEGFKRVFSMRTLYDALRSLLKLAIIGSVLTLAVWHLVPRLFGLMGVDPVAHARPMFDEVASLLFKLVLAMLVIAFADVLYTRWEFAKRMRMSRRELKDEYKQREGDPRIRARLRQLRAEVLKRSQALRKMPGADVVITNPTHFAVALAYRDGEMAAPQVVCKGAGDFAARIREVAARHAIPVVQNQALARELFFKVEADAFVPEKLYPQVARILVWVFAMRQARALGRA
jgi:flagellar biosynthetic protein FlhB